MQLVPVPVEVQIAKLDNADAMLRHWRIKHEATAGEVDAAAQGQPQAIWHVIRNATEQLVRKIKWQHLNTLQGVLGPFARHCNKTVWQALGIEETRIYDGRSVEKAATLHDNSIQLKFYLACSLKMCLKRFLAGTPSGLGRLAHR